MSRFYSFLIGCLLLFSSNLSSYDSIDIDSYLESPSFSNARALDIYEDRVYLLTQNEIYIYTSTLGYVTSFRVSDDNPVSISVSGERIYVLDEKRCSVSVYNMKGEKVFGFGECGSGWGQMISPKHIRISDGKVFVANFGRSLINIYTDMGIFLYSIPTSFKDKTYLPYRLAFDPEGYLYLVDRKNRSVAKYDFDGKFYGEYIYGFPLDITSKGFIYTGSDDGKIREYDLNFNQKGVFGTKGKNKYEFQQITDIRSYKDGIFVLDSKNKKIVSFKIYHRGEMTKYRRKNFFKERITLQPRKAFKLKAQSFLVKDNIIIFYSNEKNKEGVYIYKPDGEAEKIISYGKKEDQILNAKDILYHSGKLYVLDDANYKVKVFEDGRYLFSFGERVGFISSTKEARFAQPVRLAIDFSEKIYVLDAKIYLIQVFNRNGVFLYSIDLSRYRDERFIDLLCDGENLFILSQNKILIFTPDGRFVKTFELKGIKTPSSFCYDGSNYIFVSDRDDSRVLVYDKNGSYISSFFGRGRNDVELNTPTAIRYGDSVIYILDSLDRIVSFNLYWFVNPVSFDALYNSTSCAVEFSFEFDNSKYLKDLSIERSVDGENFVLLKSTSADKDLLPSTTYYYRVKTRSISDNVSFSDVKVVFIPSFDSSTESERNLQGSQSQSINRPPFEIIPVNLDYIFASSYKYYFSNPIGRIIIKNNTQDDFENLKLSFFIKEYMDFPYDILIDSISSGSQKEVSINAPLNSKIITITETTPLQARLTLEYYVNSEKKDVSLNIPVKILSRSSIIWDDVRRFGSFITINDPIISNLSKMLASKRDEIKSIVDDNIKIFSLIYSYLSEKGIKYVEDPVTPYRLSRSSYVIVDTVQYPRNLLKIKAGDCDDLTALFVSMLEASGVGTLIVDYGDHITGMFEIKENDIVRSGIGGDLVVEYDGRYYVPFETTIMGRDAFSSISYAANHYRNKKDVAKIYRTRDIVSIFEPPTFSEDPSFDTSISESVFSRAAKNVSDIEKRYFQYYENYYLTILKEDPQNYECRLNLAILYGMQERFEDAKNILEDILSQSRDDASALNNLANIYSLMGDYAKAAHYYERAYKSDPYDVDILLNAARNYVKMGKKDDARIVLDKASRIKPEVKQLEKEIIKEER